MMSIVEEPPEGEVSDRLYPRAYLDPTEEAAQGEFDALVHDDLVRARGAALAAIAGGLEGATPNKRGLVEIVLRPEEEMQWLTAINDARLVIGTALGVSEDGDTEYARDDPRFEYGVLYGWLILATGGGIDGPFAVLIGLILGAAVMALDGWILGRRSSAWGLATDAKPQAENHLTT